MRATLRNSVIVAGLVVAFSIIAGCAVPPVDRTRLETVHTISVGAVGEPPDTSYFEETREPRTLVIRAHIAAEARNAIVRTLIGKGYQIVPDPQSADAVLSINIKTAIYGPDKLFHQKCMPSMLIALNLKDAKGNIILQREYFYGDVSSVPAVSGWVLLRADPKYTSEDCSEYSPDRVTAAFHDMVPLLARAVGAELSKS